MREKQTKKKTGLNIWTRLLASKYVGFCLFILLTAVTLYIWKTEYDDSIKDIEYDTETTLEVCSTKVIERYDEVVGSLDRIVEECREEIQESDVPDSNSMILLRTPSELSQILWVDKDMKILQAIPAYNEKYLVGETYHSLLSEYEYQTLTYTLYKDNASIGYIIGRISMVDLILSTVRDFSDEYRVEVYTLGGDCLARSNNWEAASTVIEKRKAILVEGAETFIISLVPVNALITERMRTSIQILYYGLFIALGAFVMAMFIRQTYRKTRELERARNELMSLTDALKKQNEAMEEHLRDQQRLEIIGVLASSVAHEINNPINGIMNYGQIIIEANEKDSESASFAQEIITETKRVSTLVKNMLQFSRQRHQNFSYARPEDIIERTRSLMKTMLKHDNISLDIHIEKDLPSIQCNSQHIQQVLMNLLTNAQDALNEKYVEFDKNKVIELFCGLNKDHPEFLRITIEDHGRGIPKDIQDKIYTQFFTTKSAAKGTGLGLYITASIIKDHNGRLSFETEEGKYTRFHVDLPLCEEEE